MPFHSRLPLDPRHSNRTLCAMVVDIGVFVSSAYSLGDSRFGGGGQKTAIANEGLLYGTRQHTVE